MLAQLRPMNGATLRIAQKQWTIIPFILVFNPLALAKHMPKSMSDYLTAGRRSFTRDKPFACPV